MARIQFDVHVQGNLSEGEASAFAAGVTAFQEQCIAAGLEVRGNGLEVTHDPEPEPATPAEPIA
jgi:hypothetical protein